MSQRLLFVVWYVFVVSAGGHVKASQQCECIADYGVEAQGLSSIPHPPYLIIKDGKYIPCKCTLYQQTSKYKISSERGLPPSAPSMAIFTGIMSYTAKDATWGELCKSLRSGAYSKTYTSTKHRHGLVVEKQRTDSWRLVSLSDDTVANSSCIHCFEFTSYDLVCRAVPQNDCHSFTERVPHVVVERGLLDKAVVLARQEINSLFGWIWTSWGTRQLASHDKQNQLAGLTVRGIKEVTTAEI